ncbi:MAG UNVERIFIED_CONTAM: hypothetical protein LVR29_24280 [Microcystis novacekii LVE1205-3]
MVLRKYNPSPNKGKRTISRKKLRIYWGQSHGTRCNEQVGATKTNLSSKLG